MDQREQLHWQSQAVLLLVVPAAAVWALVLLLQSAREPATWAALGVGTTLALLTWLARAATVAGALTGGLLMACFCLSTPGWCSSGWAVLAMLVLTLASTRLGRARRLGSGDTGLDVDDAREQAHGRSASQVAANLGAAALAGTLANVHGQQVADTVMLAALAEAAADTLASELGQALGGMPRMLTSGRRVRPGTDGGVTIAGSLLGLGGACVVAWVGVVAMRLPARASLFAAAAGTAGMLFDSLLGATIERRHWLNNDAVNFLATIAAGAGALAWAELFR